MTGEKDKVIACIDMLQRKSKEMEENFSHIQVEIRQTQHMYIKRGNGKFFSCKTYIVAGC